MSAPTASETRSPFCASSEIGACSVGGVRLVVHPRTTDACGRGVLEEFLFDRVLIEPCGGAQSAGDGRAGPPLAPTSLARLSM
jgi:hypothetical protein